MLDLFSVKMDSWIQARKQAVLAVAAQHYPGDKADKFKLHDAARDVARKFPLGELPTIDPDARQCVGLVPFNARDRRVPLGVPGHEVRSAEMGVRVVITVRGNAALLEISPSVANRPHGGWPEGKIDPHAGTVGVELPGDITRREIARVHELVRAGALEVSHNLTLFAQASGWALAEFEARQVAAKGRQQAQTAMAKRLALAGFNVAGGDDDEDAAGE